MWINKLYKVIEHSIVGLIGIFAGIVSVVTLAIIPASIGFIFVLVFQDFLISILFLSSVTIVSIPVLISYVLIYIAYIILIGFFIRGFLGVICEILRKIYISDKFIGYKGNKKNYFSFSYVPLIPLNFKGENKEIYNKKDNMAFFIAFLIGFTLCGIYLILAINDFYPSAFFLKIFKVIHIAYSVFVFLVLFLIFKEVFKDIKNFIFRKGRNGE